MPGRLQDRVAVITGSTSGIGRAAALLFAEEGARVVVSGRRVALGEAVVDEIRRTGGVASFCRADVSHREDIEALIQCAMDTYGQIDILMNNAWSGTYGSVVETTEEEWDAAMAVSLKAVYLGCKFAIPQMIARGQGAIVNTASVHGILGGRGYASYEAAKAGIINLTRQVAVEYGHQGIRANAVCPGWIVVERAKEDVREHPERVRRAEAIYPVGRPGYPIDVARAALFLASDESSFITGDALMVDGGLTIQLQESVVRVAEEVLGAQGGKW